MQHDAQRDAAQQNKQQHPQHQHPLHRLAHPPRVALPAVTEFGIFLRTQDGDRGVHHVGDGHPRPAGSRPRWTGTGPARPCRRLPPACRATINSIRRSASLVTLRTRPIFPRNCRSGMMNQPTTAPKLKSGHETLGRHCNRPKSLDYYLDQTQTSAWDASGVDSV